MQHTSKPKRESYTKCTDEQKAEIAKREAEHAIASTIRHFAEKYPRKQPSHVEAAHHCLYAKPLACRGHVIVN